MSKSQVNDLLEELGLRLRHTFGKQIKYLGTTTPADEDGNEDIDIMIVLSQLSDAHIRLVWNVVASVRHTWNLMLDCRMRTTEDVRNQPLLEQYLLKHSLRDFIGHNPFHNVKVAPSKLGNECRLRITEQEDSILSLIPRVIADSDHLRGIGAATFEAVRAYLVLSGSPIISKSHALNELVTSSPAFDDLALVYKGYRNPADVSDLPGYIAIAIGIVKHLSYRSQNFKSSDSVLLVNAPSSLLPHPMDDAFGYDANMPLGLLCIAAYLRKNGIPVSLLDAYAMNLTAMGTVDTIIRDYGLPSIIAFNPSSPNINVVHTIARYIKRIGNDVTVVVGGPHATLSTQHALSSRYVDYAIVGEGELPFLALAKSLLTGGGPIDDIPGVYYVRDGELEGIPCTKQLALDSLPMPAFDLLPLEEIYFSTAKTSMMATAKKRRRAYFHSSRGCKFACTYCSVPQFWNRTVREIPMSLVIDHIEQAISELDLNEVQIVDDNFSHRNGKRIKEFCEGLIDRGLSIAWKCQVRGDQLNEHVQVSRYAAGGTTSKSSFLI